VKPKTQWNKRATLPQLEGVFRIMSCIACSGVAYGFTVVG
jgi:hypothetical protein